MSNGMTFPGEHLVENVFLAFVFDPPLDGKLEAINTVIEKAHRRGHEVRCWAFDDCLIVCVAVPDAGVDTGMDLYNVLQAQNVKWDELECAAPAEFYRAPAVPPGHSLLVYDAAVWGNPRRTLSK